MSKAARKNEVEYSEKIEGTRGNYRWPVTLDYQDGFVGIDQWDGDEIKDRVLLSPVQVKALISFVRRCER